MNRWKKTVVNYDTDATARNLVDFIDQSPLPHQLNNLTHRYRTSSINNNFSTNITGLLCVRVSII